MDKTGITIIGAGITGLATAYTLSGSGQDVLVLDKNLSYGQETSSRNSEVIHSGIYYPPGSVKSETCLRGKSMLYDLCEEHNINFRRIGKLVIATDESEDLKINEIRRNAMACGINNVEFLNRKEIKNIEPNIRAVSALLVPDTGIIDSHGLMRFLYSSAKEEGVNFAFSVEVTEIKRSGGSYLITVREPNGQSYSFRSEKIVNAAGLHSGKIARMAGLDIKKLGYVIHMCKGQYFRIRKPADFPVTHLIYPPPTNVSLGIHITPDLGGGLRVGPDALYVETLDYTVDEGLRGKFADSVRSFLPGIRNDDLIPDTSGIRPKLHGPEKLFADFIVREEGANALPDFINAVGIESPGLTSCLAIGKMIKKLLRA